MPRKKFTNFAKKKFFPKKFFEVISNSRGTLWNLHRVMLKHVLGLQPKRDLLKRERQLLHYKIAP
jgi:hypothetical protein